MKKNTRLIHKWLGLLSCLFILLVSMTAVGLNHQEELQVLFINKNNLGTNKVFKAEKIKVMASDPFYPGHIIASDFKSLFQTRDNGRLWSELKLFVPADNVNNIVFDPAEKDFLVISLKKAGLFISDDGGEVWDELKLPFVPNEGEYIENVSLGQKQLSVKTRFGLYFYNFISEKWDIQAFNNINKSSALNFEEVVYNIHTGRIFGEAGVLIYDLLSFGLILLSLSGIFLSFKPRVRAKIKNESRFLSKNEKNIKEVSDFYQK